MRAGCSAMLASTMQTCEELGSAGAGVSTRVYVIVKPRSSRRAVRRL
jgi:hypothetical protein